MSTDKPDTLAQAMQIIAEQGMWLATFISMYGIDPKITRQVLISKVEGKPDREITLAETMDRGLALCQADMAIRKAKAGGAA